MKFNKLIVIALLFLSFNFANANPWNAGVNDNKVENPNTGGYEISVSLKGHICTDNTTDTPLVGDAVFTGSWQDTLDYGLVSIGIKSDQDSATDGLQIAWSADGATVHDSDYFTLSANSGKTFTFGPARRYVKLIYTNGSVGQTSFSLETRLSRVYIKPSSHRINDSIVAEDDAELVKAVLTGENPGGIFVNFQSTTAGNFKVSLEELENAVSVNSNTQLRVTPFHADGTEGTLLSGVNYEAGKSGIDSTTETIQTISYAHHEIHSGSHFFTGNFETLANAQVYDILFVTPDTLEYAHMIFELATQAESMFNYYEGTTASANGTALLMFDRNRITDNTPSVTFYHTPTITTVGTELGAGIFGSGNKSGGSLRDSNEIMLKPNTKYLMRVTNNTAVANWYDWQFDWYEHTDKN